MTNPLYFFGTEQQYQDYISGVDPSLIQGSVRVFNNNRDFDQSYWSFLGHATFEIETIENEEELTNIQKSFYNAEDGFLTLCKVRRKVDLDAYYDSDAVLEWYYEIDGMNHLQYLYDKDVADIVTTASMSPNGTLWTFYDDTTLEMNAAQLTSFAYAAKSRDEFLWTHWGTLRKRINEASSIEELNSIDIHAGWNCKDECKKKTFV